MTSELPISQFVFLQQRSSPIFFKFFHETFRMHPLIIQAGLFSRSQKNLTANFQDKILEFGIHVL